MKKFIICCSLLCSYAFAQEYKTGLQFKDGFSTIYYTRPTAPTSDLFRKPEPATRYGLINKEKKIILPMRYKAVMTTYEPGLFIVKDTLDKHGLYNAYTNKFITAMDYYEIELFTGGLAVVKRSKDAGLVWGAVDTKGNILIPVEYDYLGSYQDGLMNFKKEGKYGFLDRNNTVVIPAMYENISDFGSGLAPVLSPETGKYGYIDKQNKMVIPANYEEAESFSQGYAVVKRKKGQGRRGRDEEVALINAMGKELTDFSYSFISARQPGGLFIAKKDKLYGLIDSTGKVVLPVSYTDLSSTFNDNFKFMTVDKKYGLTNSHGKIIVEPQYQYIGVLHDDKLLYMKKDGKISVVDKNLKTIIPADSAESVLLGDKRIAYVARDRAKIYDTNGKLLKTFMQPSLRAMGTNMISNEDTLVLYYDAAVFLANLATNTVKPLPYKEAGDFNEEGIFVAKNDKYYFVDQTGKQLNSTGYYAVVNFSDGICAVQESSTTSPYLANKNFTKIKDLTTTFKGPYSEGLAVSTGAFGTLTYLDKNGNTAFSLNAKDGAKCTDGHIMIVDNYSNYYYVDKAGKQLGKDSWKGIRDFSDGLSAVLKDGKWGFIDGTGNYVIEPKYDEASSFSNGTAIVKTGGSFILINKKGEAIDNTTYAGAGDPDKGFFPVMKGAKVGLVDSKGKTIIDFNYDNITPMYEERAWAMQNGKWGLLDKSGKALTAFIYTAAGAFSNGYAYVTIGEKAGIINKAGKLVIPAAYSNVGSVYKNMILLMKGEGMAKYSIK